MAEPTDAEKRLAVVEARLAAIERRLDSMGVSAAERALVSERPIPPIEAVEDLPESARAAETLPRVDVPEPLANRASARGAASGDLQSNVVLVGRSLIAFAGAYLLRALTELKLEWWPHPLGIVSGLLYACFWIWRAHRFAQHGQTNAAIFSTALGALIAYPLLWESASRFGSLSPESAAVLVLLVSAAFLHIARRDKLVAVAWILSAGTIGGCTALAVSTGQVIAPMLVLVVVGAALWWIADEQHWLAVAWPPAFAADLLAVAVIVLTIRQERAEVPSAEAPTPGSAATALFIAAMAWLCAIGEKVILKRQEVSPADIARTVPLLLIGLAGAGWVSAPMAPLHIGIAIFAALLAVSAYAFALMENQLPVATYYCGGVAMTSLLIASAMVSTPLAAGLLWACLAVIAALAARRRDSLQLTLHASVYALAAAIGSGLLAFALMTLTGLGHPRAPWPWSGVTIAALSAVAMIVWLLPTTAASRAARAGRLTILAVAAFLGIGAVASLAIRTTSVQAPGGAVIRSTAIAMAAVALSLLARARSFRDASLLVYPVLGFGALKFLGDDFPSGTAMSLFITLAIYGSALLAVAQFRRIPAG